MRARSRRDVVFAVLLAVVAVAAIVGALAFFTTGFAGPAPVLLVIGGGCIAAAWALLTGR